MKLIEKINKNNRFIFATIFVVIALGIIPTFNKNFTLVSFIIINILLVACFCFFSFENSFLILISVTIFEVLNVSGQPISLTASINSIFVAVFFVKYLIDLKNKKRRIDANLVIANSILLIYGLINLQFAQLEAFFSHAVMILTIYLSFVHAKEIKIKKAVLFFVGALISSIIVAAFFVLVPALKTIVIYNNERFMAFCENPNQLQIFCVIGLAMIMFLFYAQKININYFVITSLVLTTAGILTMSKSYLICLMLLLVLFLIMMYKKNARVGICVTIAMIVLVVIFVMFFRNTISAIIGRFTQYNYTSLIDNLLTGRASIWGVYISKWAQSFTSVLFGYGVTAPNLVEIGTHSVYVDMIYRYGLIGIVLIGYIIYLYISRTNNKKERFKLYNVMPLLMFLILSFVETIFYTKYIFMFVLLCSFLFGHELEETKGQSGNKNLIKESVIGSGE